MPSPISKPRAAAAWLALAALAVSAGVAATGDSPSGGELAAAAVEAMGGAAAVAALDSLAVSADCTGPGGAYESAVSWRRDGATRMTQSDGAASTTLLAIGERAWRLDPDGAESRRPTPDGVASMVHGHAFHPTLFELDRRFHEHRAAGVGEGGCLLLEMLDADQRPASVCLDPTTMLPARFTFTPAGPGGAIEMRLEDWRRIGDLRYFHAFDLRQGDDEYRWVYSSIRPNETTTGPTPSASGPTPSAKVRPLAAAWKPGDRISLSLKDADLADVLRSFAQMAGFNLVLDPSVRGSVTVELQDVPWERALEVILKTHGLAAEIDGATRTIRHR